MLQVHTVIWVGASPWDMSTALVVNDKVFKYKNKDVAIRDKDARVTITVTADAELTSSDGVVADRRGTRLLYVPA